MEPHLIDDLAYKETFYWWHRVRRHNLCRLLGSAGASRSKLLEIGCGTGANLRERSSQWTSSVGIDLELRALAYCSGLRVVQADAQAALPFADTTFDAVVLLDVLEHLADPGYLVREIGRVLTRGGAAVIMVPAGPELWSYWDEMHGHQRRYTKETLASVLGEGWRPESLEYSFSWMYPIVWSFRRFMQRRRRPSAHSDFIEIPRALNALQVVLGRIEGRVQKYVSVPFGTTLCGVWLKDGAE
mgnify:FL=1